MMYCSNVETSEGLTARLLHLATLRKRKQRVGAIATEEAKTEEKLIGREQNRIDESERDTRQSHAC